MSYTGTVLWTVWELDVEDYEILFNLIYGTKIVDWKFFFRIFIWKIMLMLVFLGRYYSEEVCSRCPIGKQLLQQKFQKILFPSLHFLYFCSCYSLFLHLPITKVMAPPHIKINAGSRAMFVSFDRLLNVSFSVQAHIPMAKTPSPSN